MNSKSFGDVDVYDDPGVDEGEMKMKIVRTFDTKEATEFPLLWSQMIERDGIYQTSAMGLQGGYIVVSEQEAFMLDAEGIWKILGVEGWAGRKFKEVRGRLTVVFSSED